VRILINVQFLYGVQEFFNKKLTEITETTLTGEMTVSAFTFH